MKVSEELEEIQVSRRACRRMTKSHLPAGSFRFTGTRSHALREKAGQVFNLSLAEASFQGNRSRSGVEIPAIFRYLSPFAPRKQRYFRGAKGDNQDP
jgi:hypothetical protein